MKRRLLASVCVAAALVVAAPAHAQRFIEHHTIEVHTEAIWPGELVAFGGLYYLVDASGSGRVGSWARERSSGTATWRSRSGSRHQGWRPAARL